MNIKICGNMTKESVDAAVKYGATHVGFIMSPGFRRSVTSKQVRAMTVDVPVSVKKVGVFVNESIDFVRETAAAAGLDIVQLHGKEDSAYIRELGLSVIKAVSADSDFSQFDGVPLLLDGPKGGSGKPFDRTVVDLSSVTHPFFIAGGLTPDNVSDAIQQFQPDGVDVSSGVETDGQKDLEKIRKFILSASTKVVMIKNALAIRPLQKADLRELWEISYGPKADLKWTETNGPYFQDPILGWEKFQEKSEERIGQPNFAVVLLENRIVGLLTSYWDDGKLQRWLEFGLVIYDSKLWGKGIGATVIPLWIQHLFDTYPDIQHLGFTTYSGNQGMMRLGEKCGLQLEGQIRKVRFWQENWYDSMKYGILRDER